MAGLKLSSTYLARIFFDFCLERGFLSVAGALLTSTDVGKSFEHLPVFLRKILPLCVEMSFGPLMTVIGEVNHPKKLEMLRKVRLSEFVEAVSQGQEPEKLQKKLEVARGNDEVLARGMLEALGSEAETSQQASGRGLALFLGLAEIFDRKVVLFSGAFAGFFEQVEVNLRGKIDEWKTGLGEPGQFIAEKTASFAPKHRVSKSANSAVYSLVSEGRAFSRLQTKHKKAVSSGIEKRPAMEELFFNDSGSQYQNDSPNYYVSLSARRTHG